MIYRHATPTALPKSEMRPRPPPSPALPASGWPATVEQQENAKRTPLHLVKSRQRRDAAATLAKRDYDWFLGLKDEAAASCCHNVFSASEISFGIWTRATT